MNKIEQTSLDYFREGYKYMREQSYTKAPFDEASELTVVNAFNEFIKPSAPNEQGKHWWQKLGIKFDGKWYTHPCTNTYDNLGQVIEELGVIRKQPTYPESWKGIGEQPVQDKRIEVGIIENLYKNICDDFYAIKVYSSNEIPKSKFPSIKQAIEKCINGEKLYTEKELLDARQDAYSAGFMFFPGTRSEKLRDFYFNAYMDNLNKKNK